MDAVNDLAGRHRGPPCAARQGHAAHRHLHRHRRRRRANRCRAPPGRAGAGDRAVLQRRRRPRRCPTTAGMGAAWPSRPICRTAPPPTSWPCPCRCSFVRTPEDFLEFTRARVPDPETGQPDMAKLGPFLEAHPEAIPAIQAALSGRAARELCAGASTTASTPSAGPNAAGAARWVRFSLAPGRGRERARGRGCRQGAGRALPAGGGAGPLLGRRRALPRWSFSWARTATRPTTRPPHGRRSASGWWWATCELTGPDTERERDRRRAGVRPHAPDRGHRALGRPDPARALARLRRVGAAALGRGARLTAGASGPGGERGRLKAAPARAPPPRARPPSLPS